MKIELTEKEIDLILSVVDDWILEWGGGFCITEREYDLANLCRKLEDYKEDLINDNRN